MRFRRELFSKAFIDEMMPLLREHYLETRDALYGPLDPNFEAYEKMAGSDCLRIYTMRDGDRLVGYQVVFIGTHPHSQHSLEATQDILYLHPRVRQGLTAAQFIHWCGVQLAKEGVEVIHQRMSAKHPWGKILERMGYELEDLTYSKRLKIVMEVV